MDALQNNSSMKTLDTTLEQYLVKQAPFAIPARWQEVLVKLIPWLTLIFFILSLPLILAFFGLSAFLLPASFIGGVNAGFGYMLAMIVLAVTLVLEALAIPGLFKNSIAAWRLLMYSTLVNAVYNLITFNLGGLIIGTLLSLYILYQIKHHYR
jgi:hypothetical protein